MARFERSSGREPRGRRDFDRGGRDRDRAPLEMTRVVCSECNRECEVPFRPNTSKPVYCRDCFDKRKGSESRGRDDRPQRRFDRGGSDSNNSSRNDFEVINKKLDRIMEALNID